MRRAALLVLDGWGFREDPRHNAVHAAGTPRLEALRGEYPFAALGASGAAVGLPAGQMGNSEVGHLNLGAGRIVYQDLTRINLSIQDGSFFDNPVLAAACREARSANGALHLLGLLSDGGVHSHQEHLHALLALARRQGLERVFVHGFLDGRDTPPQSGLEYVAALERAMEEVGVGRLATLCGRYYAMDRDTRWERVEAAYRAICRGEGRRVTDARHAVAEAYAEGQGDEFVVPRVLVDADATPVGQIRDGDAVVFFNFRADRARELTRALTEERFDAFEVAPRPHLSAYVTFTQYDEDFLHPVAFPQQRLENILGAVVSAAGLRQLRIAETEKYAHVTFFFNGGEEDPWPREERVLIPSPREVATYDLKPEMSAFEVRDRLLREIGRGAFDFIVANFANLDMVGHTGDMEAAKAAVRTVDTCVGDVVDALQRHGYAAIVTADHGNAEQMWDPASNQPHTAHSTNRVPCIIVDERCRGRAARDDGILADVAPTLLELMGLARPQEMTGRSLLRDALGGEGTPT